MPYFIRLLIRPLSTALAPRRCRTQTCPLEELCQCPEPGTVDPALLECLLGRRGHSS